jgi:hypothetical protein
MRELENKKLDEIGKLLVKAGTTPNVDIERAVANPELYDAIKNRIAMVEGYPARRSKFLVPGIASFASVALVAVIAVAYFKSGTQPPKDVVVAPVSKAAVSKEFNKHSEPDRTGTPSPVVEAEPIKPYRVSQRVPTVRTSRVKQPTVQQARFVDDFYAVSYAGDPHETERGGRIVRVDIPRSTLFAMGINVPLENESATVKADLLVGSDGVTRAIRVVE